MLELFLETENATDSYSSTIEPNTTHLSKASFGLPINHHTLHWLPHRSYEKVWWVWFYIFKAIISVYYTELLFLFYPFAGAITTLKIWVGLMNQQ